MLWPVVVFNSSWFRSVMMSDVLRKETLFVTLTSSWSGKPAPWVYELAALSTSKREHVKIHTHTNPRGRLNWPCAITRPTTYFTCGLVSALAICKRSKAYGHVMTPNVLTQPGYNETTQTRFMHIFGEHGTQTSDSRIWLYPLKCLSWQLMHWDTFKQDIITAQWEGMGDVGLLRYERALLPPCLTIRVLRYSKTPFLSEFSEI